MKTGTFQYQDRIEVLIPLPPYTKKNSSRIFLRKTSSGNIPFIVPSAAYKQYEADCAFFVKALGINEPVNIQAKFYMSTKRKTDLTNLMEALHDIFVKYGLLADDNSKIVVSCDGSRVYYDKDNPRTEVIITKTKATFP